MKSSESSRSRRFRSALGSDRTFTRWTGTFRGYLPVTDRLNLAVRVLGETVTGDLPVTLLPDMGSSLGDLTELGGGRTIRGVFRARLLDRRRGFANLEARWRDGRFGLLGQRVRPGVVAVFDAGRVWSAGESVTLDDLVWGAGGGGRHPGGEPGGGEAAGRAPVGLQPLPPRAGGWPIDPRK